MPRNYKKKTDREYAAHKAKTLPEKFEVGFLAAMDGREKTVKILYKNRSEIVADVGGESELSHVQNALIERFVWLEAILQTLEHDIATGVLPKSELGKWIQGVNSLTGLAKVLGIERRTEPLNLQTYIETTNGKTETATD